ncbi:hypothetical protein [uncultured Nostoc sp.]|uniref:hypothetical protein n=1 Tax=uncultured Nostoc sp. TaxID=340711 RepID=UPI0035CAD71C
MSIPSDLNPYDFFSLCAHTFSSKVKFWGNCHFWQERSPSLSGGDRFNLCLALLYELGK